MKNQQAFTLLELLISITLSSFIMLGVMQLYQGVTRYLENIRVFMQTNRKACLLFNQMERDFSSAFIPFLAQEKKEEKSEQASEQEQSEQTPDVKKREQREQERRKTFFISLVDEQADVGKIDNKRVEACKQISFITTNALQVYGEKRQRLVRVIYEVVKDKAKSTRDYVSYKIIRKETTDLMNVQGKSESQERNKGVRAYTVLDDVKGFFIEYVMQQQKKKGEEKKEMHSYKWGDVKERQGIVPQKMLVWLDMWNETRTKSVRFNCMIPLFLFPTVDEKKRKKRLQKTMPPEQEQAKEAVDKAGVEQAMPNPQEIEQEAV